MPNWCNNRLLVRGPAADVRAFREKARGRSPWPESPPGEPVNPLNFHSLVPIPAEVLARDYSEAGYEWERANWGVKWGARHTQLVDHRANQLEYEFDTAWVPPLPFLQQVAAQWPRLEFRLDYEEAAMGLKATVTVAAGTGEDSAA